jgi:hypothetical protein
LDFHVHGAEHWICDEFAVGICGLLVHDISDHPPLHYGGFHVLLVQGCEARNGGHSASHLYLKQVILICHTYH